MGCASSQQSADVDSKSLATKSHETQLFIGSGENTQGTMSTAADSDRPDADVTKTVLPLLLSTAAQTAGQVVKAARRASTAILQPIVSTLTSEDSKAAQDSSNDLHAQLDEQLDELRNEKMSPTSTAAQNMLQAKQPWDGPWAARIGLGTQYVPPLSPNPA